MKIIIPDSNVVFSSLRQKDSKLISLLEEGGDFAFYTPNFLVVELFKHRERLRAKSKLNEDEFLEVLNGIVQKINFFNETFISVGNFIAAYRLCKDIDPKDTVFVALTFELEGQLWTRDEELRRGLLKKGFRSFFDENE